MNVEPKCPQCHGPLVEIRYPSDSYLNRDQWESQLAGNWLCEKCPDNGRAKNKKCYWWTREVIPASPAPPLSDARVDRAKRCMQACLDDQEIDYTVTTAEARAVLAAADAVPVPAREEE